MLAGVWDRSDIVGGAFWTIADSDPFSATDVVHPPDWSDDRPADTDEGGVQATICGMRRLRWSPARIGSSSGRTQASCDPTGT